MKSSRMAIGIAAALAVASLGFEARAKGWLTRAECEKMALDAYNSGAKGCSSKTGLAYRSCMTPVELEYAASKAICLATTSVPPP